MKQLSLPRILWLMLFFSMNLIMSCDKEESPKPDYLYYNLTPEQIAQSPYFAFNKYDTLSFFNTKGDTFTFGKIKTDTAYREGFYVDVGSGHETYYFFQYLHNTYQTIKGDGRLEIWHKTSSGSDAIFININWQEFGYYSSRVGKKLDMWPFYEEYFAGNKLFKNVTLFSFYPEYNINSYINVDDGLITFINNQTSDTLQLIKK